MALTPWWGFCQTLLRPVWGMEQSRGAGSPLIPIPAVITMARCRGVSLCLCSVSLCLGPPLFIAIYCLFIILPTTTPAVFNIECSPRCPGAEGVPASLLPPELAPAVPGVGGPVASKLCPLRCHRPGEGGRNELSPGSESPGVPLPPGTPRLPEDRRARPLSRRAPGPRSLRPERDRCSRSIPGPAAPQGAPRSFPTGTARGRHRRSPIAAAGSLRVNCVLITG